MSAGDWWLPYCPACGEPLENVADGGGRCWSVCALAGHLQPAIHFAEFEEDTYEVHNGYGLVATYTVRRRVNPHPS